MCLEVSYRNIRITERWKRNRSDVCAWKYHTEILELQRDAWKRNRSVVCAWKYHTTLLIQTQSYPVFENWESAES